MIRKYRAWLKDHGETRNVKRIEFEETYSFFGPNPPHVTVEGWCDLFPLDKVVLFQSTGLKDKNGAEIFEGDPVKTYDEYIGEVIYKDGEFCVYMEWDSDIGTKRKPNIVKEHDTESLKAFVGDGRKFIEILEEVE